MLFATSFSYCSHNSTTWKGRKFKKTYASS